MWCPNCKMEYRDGIKVCADCGTELVEGTADDFYTADICKFKEEQTADRFLEYLEYSGLKKAKKVKNEEGVFAVTVPEKQMKKAEKLFRGFLLALEEETEAKAEEQKKETVESPQADDSDSEGTEAENPDEEEAYNWDEEEQESDAVEEEEAFDFNAVQGEVLSGNAQEDPGELLYTASDEFVTKEDEYKDLKFSGLTFLLFAVLGWSFIALCWFDILPLHYSSFALAAFLLLFGVFFVIAMMSFIKSSKVKLEIPAEEEKTKEILDWLREELTEDIIDSWKDANASAEENDLLVTSHIRASLAQKYPKEKVSYLEYLTERYYNEALLTEEEE